MRKLVFAVALVAAACGGAEKQEERLAELEVRPAMTTVIAAEAAYDEVAEFVDDLNEDEEPAVLERASKLREKRALEFRDAMLRHRAFGSTTKVLKALRDSGAPIIGSLGAEGDDANGTDGLDLGQIWRFIGPPGEIEEKQ